MLTVESRLKSLVYLRHYSRTFQLDIYSYSYRLHDYRYRLHNLYKRLHDYYMYCDQIYGYRLNSYNYCMTIVIDYTGVNYMVIESYRAFIKISTLY